MKKVMHGKNRLMSILLCFALVTGSMGTGAFAGSVKEPSISDDAESAAIAETAHDENTAIAAEERPSAGEEAVILENEENAAPEEEADDPENDELAAPVEESVDEDQEETGGLNEEHGDEDQETGELNEEPEKPGDEDQETDALIEEPLPDDGIMATDNAALSDSTVISASYVEYSWDEESRSLITTTVTPESCKALTSDPEELASGTYVVSEDMTIDHYISVRKEATVNLVVEKGVTLTCTKGIGCGYSKDGKYASLNIFGEGSVVANGKENAAGIGGGNDEASGNITIHGTTVTATGGKHGAGIGGGEGGKDPDGKTSIRIYAGTVTATGGIDGAGIGGGDEQPGAHTYIYSGTITAESKKHGAGIGGGDEEGTLGIFIYGGKVTATGGHHGAGIGAGEEGGSMREAPSGGVNIYGGDITATGGSGGAGIGGGFDEEMSGTIIISGYDTKLTVTGGMGGAGIGAGSGDWGANGDVNGTITIDCGKASDINITAGGTGSGDDGGAGIGAGYEGNMDGTFYYKNGNVVVTSGWNAAGIGGGAESPAGNGGGGGTAYIGGGNLKIKRPHGSSGAAIGAGETDFTDGTTYIAADNNGTGKYLRVDYSQSVGHAEGWKTATASNRSHVCHMLFTSADITECNHEDIEGKSGLTYSIVGEQHRKQCKYCGLDVKENHKGADCECGYRSDTCTIWFNDESGHSSLTVARGKEFELPDYGGLVMSGDSIPPNLYRIKGWKLDGDTSGRIYEQGEIVAADADMSFVSDRERMYRIEFDEVPHGSIRTNMTDRVTYAAEGETISFGVETDPGYSVSKVTYKIMQGYETDSTHDVIYHYSDPVQISPVDGKYQLTMPEMTSTGGADNNRMIITAECEESKAVTVEGVTGSFNDKIKLNYYLNIPDDVRADENACVKITNENTGKGVTLLVGDAVFDEEKGGYKFSIPLAAKEASDTITAKVLDGSGGAITLIGKKSGKDYTGAGVPYTLMQYFDWLKKNGKEDEKPLGAAAQDYCASAQIYFEYNADDVSVSSEVQAVTAETLSRYIADREGSLPGGVSIKGISAMLESDNTLRLYYEFKGDDPTGFTFKIDGHETELKQRSDGMRYLALDEGVYSNKLQDTHTYTVSDGTAGGTYTITASVLTYARSCANKSKESESNLGKALYLYNQAAVVAFGE